jgi:class 3 adenylate cyclase
VATELGTRACPRCGSAAPPDARFCPSCGGPLEEALGAERRIVTVLFGDLSGFTELSERLDPEAVKAIVDRAFEGLAEIVTLYGGRVDKVIGDEIMAVFGAPQAHEDDAERAVRCALEMQRQLAQLSRQLERERGVSLGMRIGINTGEVVAGPVGGAEAYSVIGDAVNAAKRIEAAARPGEVLVGEETYRATAQAIEYREREPIVAKGKSEPLRVWEAVAERALPGERTHRLRAPLTGRDEELRMLEALADVVRRDRRAAVATILGAAGMGKSRLADETARRLAARGARVLAGRSLPYGTASPSFAVEEIVRAALGLSAGAPAADAPDRARALLADLGLAADADRILALAGLREAEARARPAPAVGPAARTPPAGPLGESLRSAAAFLEALAAREELLLLVLHELHWAEEPLLAFVADLLERARDAPILLLCLARPDGAERRFPWLGRPGSLVHVLEPLPHDRAAALLDALAGGGLHPAIRASILERAGGNPFFIEELVRLMRDRGAASAADALAAATAVPATVQALVSARLDALPPGARRVLQMAAVVGDEFWVAALERLAPGRDRAAIERDLEALVRAELIEPVERPSVPGQRAFRFRQALVREVASAAVPKRVRAHQHAAVGAWLEEVACACGMERAFADLVAHHYERAARLAADVGIELPEARAKAREYLERAGRQALALDAAAAAADFFGRALEYARDDADRIQLQLHLGEALVGCWRPAEAERHLRAALEGARRLGDRRAEAKALRLLGDLLRIRGEVEEGRRLLERALELARALGDRAEEADGLRSHGLADLFQGRLAQAPIWFRQALARYRELGDRRGEAWSLVNLAWVDLLLGRLDAATASLEEALPIFSAMGDAEGIGWCLGLRAWALLFEGRLAEAEAEERRIQAMLAVPVGARRGLGGFGWAIGQVLLAFVALDRARLAEAEAHARQGLLLFEESDAVWGLAMARFPLGVSQHARRLRDEARATFREARAHAERAADPLVTCLVTYGAALVAFGAGELEGAERLARESLATSEASGISWLSDVPLRHLRAAILRARGRPAEAVALLEAAPGGPARLFEESRAVAELAEALADLGRHEDAAAAARRGIAGAGEDVVGRAWCLRALGRALHLARRDDEAERTLREELDLLRETDWDEERVHALALLAAVLEAERRHDEVAVVVDEARAVLARFPAGADVRDLAALLGS